MIRFYWTPERLKTLRRMAGHHSSKEIGEALGVEAYKVTDKARRIGLKLMLSGEKHHLSKTTNQDRDWVFLLLSDGSSISQISKILDLPYRRIQSIIRYSRA